MSCIYKLSEVCSIQSGGTPSRSVAKFWGGSIPWAKISDLEKSFDGFISDTEEKITDEGLNAIRGRIFTEGTLLFAMYGSVGKTAIVRGRVSTNQAILGIYPNPKFLNLFYLKYWLAAQQNRFEKDAQGVAQKNLSAGYLRDLEIPLPPLPEQRRIAAILDKADAVRRKRQESIRLTEEFLRSVFLDMFGDPVMNPKGWPKLTVGSGLESIDAGWSANGDDRSRQAEEWAVLRISAVTSGRFLPAECKVVSEKDISRPLIVPRRGDLLFSRANTRELVAATCLVETDETHVFLPDKLWRIVTNKKKLCPEYLKYLLSHSKFRELLTKQATGTSGSMLNVSMAKLRNMEMPFPPLGLQKDFAKIVWKTMDVRQRLETFSLKGVEMFDSCVHRAFRGEL